MTLAKLIVPSPGHNRKVLVSRCKLRLQALTSCTATAVESYVHFSLQAAELPG
jgi:hypothetical protein